MSDLFTLARGDDHDFDAVLKQLDEVFCGDIAAICAERHFSWDPVFVTPKSGKHGVGLQLVTILTPSSCRS
jgi:hypothetical protein